jgi:beta-lactamase regulating signal transducer with metallopeptidase domain/HEAT repeat protein
MASMLALAGLLPLAMVLLKASAVLVVAFALTWLMSRTSATARHLVWVATFVALAALPLLEWYSPIRLPLLPSGFAARDAAVPSAVMPSSALPSARPTTGDVAASTAAPDPVFPAAGDARETVNPWRSVRLPALLATVWAGVALAMLGWIAWGLFGVQRLLRGAIVLDEPAWHGPLMDIADRLELTEVPRLVCSAKVTMPFACGLRAPTVVLPADCTTWTRDRRTAVLLHELAHVRRRDLLGHTLARVCCALYWFHPLVWVAMRRLRAESERACDDLALACGTRPSDYAEHLLDILTSVRAHRTPTMAMAMATRSEFEGRMLAILDPHLTRTAPTRLQASTLAGGVMMFAIVTGAAIPRDASSPPPDARAVAALDTAADSTGDAVAAPLSRPVPAVRAEQLPVDTAVRDAAPEDEEQPERAATDDSTTRTALLARVLASDTAASLRRTAAWALSERTDDPVALNALLTAVRADPSAVVREMAAWSLGSAHGDARVGEVLIAALRSERSTPVRNSLVWALGDGAGGDQLAVLDALVSALADDDGSVRELAAWGVGQLSPRRAPAAIIEALGDREAAVRATAAWALFQIEDGETAGPLDRAIQRESNADARWAMVRAISVMGDRAVGPLQRIIEGPDTAARALAIRALAGRGGEPWPKPRPRPRPYP